MSPWYRLLNENDVPSPALLIFPDRVAENVQRMIAIAGGAERLRPHVKTHKLPQVLDLQLKAGITKFKAATLAEVEMCAAGDAPDVLLAYPPVGPNARRLVELVRRFPQTRFLTVLDDPVTVTELGAAAQAGGVEIGVLLDLNVGMNRTGIRPGDEAFALYGRVAATPGLRVAGLHAYDGHLHQRELDQRTQAAEAAFASVWAFRNRLQEAGLEVPLLVASGTPTLPVLAREPGVELGAGTTVFWDFGYADTYPDLDFQLAAVLLTRVISRPAPNHLTLDLGHKAVASEMPHPRVRLWGLEEASFVMHSEEHLVLETPRAADFPVGTVLYGVPRHICPTVALYSEVWAVREQRAQECWPVVARARRLTI